MRLSIDLDNPATIVIARIWIGLKQVGDGDVKGRVSSSGEGIHLETFGVEDSSIDTLRADLGDDEYRILLDDVQHWRPSQVLYDEKQGKRSGEWVFSLDALLREYRAVRAA